MINRDSLFEAAARAAVALLLCQILPAASNAQRESGFGGSFAQLHPRQQELMRRWAEEYRVIYKRQLSPEKIYDALPLSARTTFQAVTHALMNSKLTSKDGKSLGTALDLIELVERFSGQVPDTRGDRQFRVYVYLKPSALNILYQAKEFERGRDNTVYHLGYPINFRQQGGVPSVQISVARTGRRADIDVDYRSSAAVKALVSGHLTSANSDVRAGNNEAVHNRRWSGLSNWWRDIMAALMEKAPAKEPEEGITPGAEAERKRIARGPIHEAIHAYLTDWLIERRPEELLPLFSVKAYPCIAEFGGDSRPDSKLALLRILRRLQERNKSLGVVSRLEDVVSPVSYRLPDSLPASHPHEKLFSLQEVPDDVAWAIDCRIRYGLQMAESIPRPPHKLNKTFVASMRIKDQKEPQAFIVQTWTKESGEWRIVSIDLKRKTMSPPANLLTASSAQASTPEAAQLSTEVDKLLTHWLMKKQTAEAAKFFLPDSYACDAFHESHAPARQPSAADPKNLIAFLEEVASHALPDKQLEGIVAAVEADHHELKPLAHERRSAFLLAETSGDLFRMSSCQFDPASLRARTPAATSPAKGHATAFRLVRPQGEESAAITLHWKQTPAGWRVASYHVTAD
jgi:hypothetical protein